jgi:uncharacterized protein (DUF983 family)
MIDPISLTPLKPSAPGVWSHPPDLPDSLGAALRRGLRNRCPRCGETRLMPHFLKPVRHCHACGQDWTLHRADDFPAYISMIITGHLLAPVMIMLALAGIRPWLLVVTVIPGALVLMLGLLQPAKGAVIAAQWWFGMHGFRRERRAELGG